jgi:hypothetical protein
MPLYMDIHSFGNGVAAEDVHREAHGLVADEIYQVQEGS